MARPLRPPDPGGTYHVTARSVQGAQAFGAERDRHAFLKALSRISDQAGWVLLAYCLMTNHYHLLLRDTEGTLSRGMQHLNGGFSREFNRRYGRSGALWDRRFHAERVVREAHLLETARYIPLNPVRAGVCESPEEWAWSSHRATVGLPAATGPGTALLALLDEDAAVAQRRYEELIADGLAITRGYSSRR